MRIGILTFHCAINYGAVLQAFCLQEYLKSLGHDVFIINYRPPYLTRKNNFSFKNGLKYNLREFLLIPVRWLRIFRFKKFESNYLNLSCFDLNKLKFDVYLFGSDQIWNPLITKGFDRIFFGDFPSANNSKKVAYAASCGSLENITEEDWDKVCVKLRRMDLIGVRENPLRIKLESLLHKKVDVVLDPVLLAGREAFSTLRLPTIKKRKYLLIFAICGDSQTLNWGYEIAKRLNLDVVELVSAKEYVKRKHVIQTASPLRFVSLFKNADYVVTSSFHGTAFSLLFNKKFNYLSINDELGERVFSLLKLLKLQNRIIKPGDIVADTSSIDFSAMNERLDYFRDSSKSFLADL